MEIIDVILLSGWLLTVLVPINGLLFLGIRNERRRNKQIREAITRLRLLTKPGRK